MFNKNLSKTKFITIVAVFSAISYILSFMSINFPPFPIFLKFDLADVPALFALFATGPFGAIAVVLIKNLLSALNLTTLGIGEFANFSITSVFIITFWLTLKNKNSLKNYILSTIIAATAMTIVACILNLYVLIPAYAALYGTTTEAIAKGATAINKNITSVNSLIVFGIAPFNIIKALLISAITYPIYKISKPFLKSFNL